jgi:hypothetical protein
MRLRVGGTAQLSVDKAGNTVQLGTSTAISYTSNGAGSGKLALTASGGGTFGFQAPAVVTSYTWTVPGADAQGVVTSNGAGILSITNPATYNAVCSGTASATATLFLFMGGASAIPCTDTTENLKLVVATAGTIRNLRVKAGTAGVGVGSGAMTIRKNGVDTTVTCTCNSGNNCSDTTHSFTVVAGDQLSIKMVTIGGETLANVAAAWEKE